MVRILLRGGIWSNSEDEILKAAVMKYGKTQWARVASLLNRKSPKQCKARWFEWLDPSIRKTEWTRDEEEKLLHLAKLYPSQWRTVAPLVGRTAAQCVERYERLLDEARRELDDDGGAADGTQEEGGGPDEARKLRPGEIDPAPETRPARPDPVDMDEDEKEMLSEARARLANTRGKKAKRKAREAQLDEARRLASLQKRRELKAAGIHAALGSDKERRVKRKRNQVDYGAEIPFQMVAPAGFYDTADEKKRSREVSQEQKRNATDFEAKRIDEYETDKRNLDERRARLKDQAKRNRLMKDDLPKAIEQVSALNDPSSLLKRSELTLPAPLVSADDVADLAKMEKARQQRQRKKNKRLETINEEEAPTDDLLDSRDLLGAAALMADRAATARTPRVPRSMDSIAQEAVNAVRDRDLDTPLLGQDQADRLEGTGYDGAKPRPFSSGAPGAAASTTTLTTPFSVAPTWTPLTERHRFPGEANPPLRQALLSVAGGAPLARQRENDDSEVQSETASRFSRPVSERSATSFKLQKRQVRVGLDHLPAPKYAYDVELPPQDRGDDEHKSFSAEEEEEVVVVVDAAEREAREAAANAEAERRRLARRTSAVRRDLPRPRCLPADPEVILPKAAVDDDDAAAGAIRAEALALIARDAVTAPPRGGVRPSPAVARLAEEALLKEETDPLDDEILDHARALIEEETSRAFKDNDHSDADAAFEAAWKERHDDVVFFPEEENENGRRGVWGTVSEAPSAAALVGAYKSTFTALRAQMAKGATRAARVEGRLEPKIQPHLEKAAALRNDIATLTSSLDRAAIEAACFHRLHNLEAQALPTRKANAKDRLDKAHELERHLQAEHQLLEQQRDALLQARQLQTHTVQTPPPE